MFFRGIVFPILETSSTTDAATENGDHPTPYQRLLETLQFDSKVKWELALGKRVGFYVLRGELGCGNFSRVKAGVHALTKGKPLPVSLVFCMN